MKYSPGGGPIEVRVLTDVGAVLLQVADHGIGMSPEHAEHCFDRFWQAEAGDTRRFGGTGIGLFIVRSVAEAMDGHVTVESHLGRGSTFTLRLPVAPQSA